MDVTLSYAENKAGKHDDFVIINTNARSLCPKVDSFIDNFNELEASLAVITETWMNPEADLETDLEDLALGAGIGMLVRCRPPSANGVSYGGVAVAFRVSGISLKELKIPNPSIFEVLVATGSIV